ncbi:hypothetical protein PRIPAC_94789 [Pristionchus pacificus]|uniref:Uncharacterized protein n=1 Tax=Pristionchus pacificus TaxID=54126 RepID=A0A2A6BBP8_PRIPA|nr:hypothetical protein PRIPAC_94789 [Pristionchus pacificus]|eukprot:PDM63297.1 hypothetical protein PRIPAC_50512 [Pristionchus pacificus]
MSGLPLLAMILGPLPALLVGCFSSKKNPKPKAPLTPEPTPPQGVPLGGSGERDDHTLKNVPSLQKDLKKNKNSALWKETKNRSCTHTLFHAIR